VNNADTTTGIRRDTPDAVGRGSMGAGGDGSSTLFVLAGSSLGATLIEGEGAPQWFDLRQVVALDALGDPEGPKIRVEVAFESGERFEALWPEPFCDKVVARLEELFEAGAMSRGGGEVVGGSRSAPDPFASPPGNPSAASAQPFAGATPFGTMGAAAEEPPAGPSEAAASGLPPSALPAAESAIAVDLTRPADAGPLAPTNGTNGANGPAPMARADLPMPGDGPPLAATPNESGERELVLRDVIYHGGFPGEPKRRKKCTLVLGGGGIQVSGPTGPQVQLGWDQVRSIEAQNADEAKFRLNLRTKRGSTTLVIECGDESTVLVEARDVATLPLRAAVSEIVAGRGVVVA
jgi:hypothetical protein